MNSWGQSWGAAWSNAWGAISQVIEQVGGGGAKRRSISRIRAIQEEEDSELIALMLSAIQSIDPDIQIKQVK